MDKNEFIIERLRSADDNCKDSLVDTLEMETGYLLYASQLIKNQSKYPIKTAALQIVYANRSTNQFLMDDEKKFMLQNKAALICLNALYETSHSILSIDP